MTAPERTSLLRCPHFGHAERLTMPDDACVFFHVCGRCGVVLRPKAGDCCVFCSYGSVPGTLSHWSEPQGPVLLVLFVVGAVGCAAMRRRRA